MDVVKNLKLSATTLDLESRWNCNYTRLQVFELLLLFPFFIVKNAFQYTDSTVPDPYYLDKKVKLVELFSYHKLGLTNKYTHLFGDS